MHVSLHIPRHLDIHFLWSPKMGLVSMFNHKSMERQIRHQSRSVLVTDEVRLSSMFSQEKLFACTLVHEFYAH